MGSEVADTSSSRLRALTDLARALAGVHGFAEVIKVSAEQAHQALGARTVSLSEYVRATGRLRVLINHGDLVAGAERFPEAEWYAVRQDVDEHTAAALHPYGDHSVLTAPIFFAGQVWGELHAVRTPETRPYGREDLDFATALAALVSAGLAQADRHEYLERLAYTDELTGLANRRAIEIGLDEAMDLHRLTDLPVALIVCDVNGLKRVNDTVGHDRGDIVLERLAAQLSAAASKLEGALAARIGGDEFGVLVAGQSFAAVAALADDITVRAGTVPEIAGAACGFATTDGPAGPVTTRDLLFRLADAAQYAAKREGSAQPVAAGPEHRRLAEAAASEPVAAPRKRRQIRREPRGGSLNDHDFR